MTLRPARMAKKRQRQALNLSSIKKLNLFYRSWTNNLKNFLCQRFVAFRAVSENSSHFSLFRRKTSPRRSSRLWQVLVFCFHENNFLRNAVFSTNLTHFRQMFSGTATRIKVLVGVVSSSITKPLVNFARCEKYFDSLTGSACKSLRQNDATWCETLQGKQVALSLAIARSVRLALRVRATRSKARLVSKSNATQNII